MPADPILEEQSKRLFWVIQTVFSFVIARSLLEFRECVLSPLSPANYMATIGLVLAGATTIWSWIDYSYSTIVSPYNFGRGRLEKFRFCTDLIIVMCYSYLLFAVVDLKTHKGMDLSPLLVCISLIFALYVASGLLRVFQYGWHVSRFKTNLAFVAVFFLTAVCYRYLYWGFAGHEEILNVVFLLASIVGTVAYRLLRSRAAFRSRWIAVDIDGVIANQIVNILPIAKEKHGVDLGYNDIKEWDLKVGESDIASIIRDEQRRRRYVANMPTIESARDYIGNIVKYLQESDGKAILFNQPWNQDRTQLQRYLEDGRLLVAKDWPDVLKKVRQITASSDRG